MKVEDALSSWQTLNTALQNCTEKFAGELFAAEMKGKRRPQHLRRIHSRVNFLRAHRERKAIERATRNHRHGD